MLSINCSEKIKNSVLMQRPIEETLNLIEELDLDDLRKKLCSSSNSRSAGYGWPNEETHIAISAYKEYLKLVAIQIRESFFDKKKTFCAIGIQSPNKSIPTQVVDIVWHTHILFTHKYFEDCKNIFGFYLHHSPNIEED